MLWETDVFWVIHDNRVRINEMICLFTALCAHGTSIQRRSTSLCSSLAPSRVRRSSPHAAPTAATGSSSQRAAKMAPSRSGTETSVWVLKHKRMPAAANVQWIVNIGCLFSYGLKYRVMRLRSQAREVRGRQIAKPKEFKMLLSKLEVAQSEVLMWSNIWSDVDTGGKPAHVMTPLEPLP